MLLEKYEPKSVKEIVGNLFQINAIRDFLKGWRQGTALFICGPPGIGKTLSARLIAKEMGYQLVEGSEIFDKSEKDNVISSSKQKSMLFSRKLFLFDENDIGLTKTIGEMIAESRFPIILIGENPYDRRFMNTRKYFKIIKFVKPNDSEVAKFLSDVCRKEGIAIEAGNINQLARMCNGDIRAALVDLDIMRILKTSKIGDVGHREQMHDIFNLLKIIFRATSIINIKSAFDGCEDPEKLIAWIGENIQNEIQDIAELASAYDYLSKADVFRSRIVKRQAWSLQKYYFELSTIGMMTKNKKTQFANYNPPRYFNFSINSEAMREKIGRAVHVSKKRSDEYLPVLKTLVKGKNKKDVIDALKLDDSDIKALNRPSPIP